MKRVIAATLQDSSANPFKMDTTTSYYNNFLNPQDLKYMQDSKNRTGQIEMISPNEYFQHCADDIFEGTTVAKLKMGREASRFREDNRRFIDKYAEDMKKGDKFPLCYLNYADGSQEGLHRMYAAGEVFGWDTKFPVLCVYVFDQARHQAYLLRSDMQEFQKYTLEDICKEVEDQLSDWNSPPPDNFIHTFESEICQEAKSKEGKTIQVACTLDEEPPKLGKITVCLTSYEGLQLQYPSDSYTTWIQDIFDCRGTKYDDPDS